MKRISIEELPDILTEDIIAILVDMALENPQSSQWHEVFDVLDERGQLMIVLDRARAKQKTIEQAKEDAKSEEQKLAEEEHKKKFYANLNPKDFFGNMGEPETPEQYKDKYGVWPPGYKLDEGN